MLGQITPISPDQLPPPPAHSGAPAIVGLLAGGLLLAAVIFMGKFMFKNS